jgi:hypothetical protein
MLKHWSDKMVDVIAIAFAVAIVWLLGVGMLLFTIAIVKDVLR